MPPRLWTDRSWTSRRSSSLLCTGFRVKHKRLFEFIKTLLSLIYNSNLSIKHCIHSFLSSTVLSKQVFSVGGQCGRSGVLHGCKIHEMRRAMDLVVEFAWIAQLHAVLHVRVVAYTWTTKWYCLIRIQNQWRLQCLLLWNMGGQPATSWEASSSINICNTR